MSIDLHEARESEMASGSTTWSMARSGSVMRWLAGVGAVLLAGLLFAVAIDTTSQPAEGLTGPVQEQLDRSGVANPVTAVLLNFRGVDTWLELGVLVLAVMGMLGLQGRGSLASVPPIEPGGYVLQRMTRLLVPLMIVGGGYLLWRGTHAPGGAFQAGALLAAAGVILRLSGGDALRRLPGWLLRGLVVFSFGLFAVLGLVLMLWGRHFLEYPPAVAGTWILIIEIAATISIAAALWALFVGAHPAPVSGLEPSETKHDSPTN